MSRYHIALGKTPPSSKEGDEPFVGTKIIESEGNVNFVDTNNIFVGYEITSQCCENADWFFLDEPAKFMPKELNKREELKGFVFDPQYFKEIEILPDEEGFKIMMDRATAIGVAFDAASQESSNNSLDDGGMVIFRLQRHCGHSYDYKYLHLFNQHNGYYSHGFEMKIGDKEIRSQSI